MNQENNNVIKNDVHKTSAKKFGGLVLVIGILSGFIIGFEVGKLSNSGNEDIANEVESENQESPQATPEPVDLTTGIWTCGEDIAPGRYIATPVPATETGAIYTDGSTDINEILGPSIENGAVPSVTFTLEEGDTIEVNELPAIHFEPVE